MKNVFLLIFMLVISTHGQSSERKRLQPRNLELTSFAACELVETLILKLENKDPTLLNESLFYFFIDKIYNSDSNYLDYTLSKSVKNYSNLEYMIYLLLKIECMKNFSSALILFKNCLCFEKLNNLYMIMDEERKDKKALIAILIFCFFPSEESTNLKYKPHDLYIQKFKKNWFSLNIKGKNALIIFRDHASLVILDESIDIKRKFLEIFEFVIKSNYQAKMINFNDRIFTEPVFFDGMDTVMNKYHLLNNKNFQNRFVTLCLCVKKTTPQTKRDVLNYIKEIILNNEVSEYIPEFN